MAKTMTKIRTGYEDREAVRMFFPKEDDLTHQSEAAACDINHIMQRFEKQGVLDHVNRYQGDYGDFTESVDFHTAMSIVSNAQQMFDSLPAVIRSRFGNDPGAFVDFVSDDENEDEMRKMGLIPMKADDGEPPSPAPKAAAKPEKPAAQDSVDEAD